MSAALKPRGLVHGNHARPARNQVLAKLSDGDLIAFAKLAIRSGCALVHEMARLSARARLRIHHPTRSL